MLTTKKKSYKGKIILTLVLISVLLFSMVNTSAMSSRLQYEINSLSSDINTIERDITDIKIEIQKAANITNLEDRAFALGLDYPSFDRIVYLYADSENIEDFAMALKETAYNK